MLIWAISEVRPTNPGFFWKGTIQRTSAREATPHLAFCSLEAERGHTNAEPYDTLYVVFLYAINMILMQNYITLTEMIYERLVAAMPIMDQLSVYFFFYAKLGMYTLCLSFKF